MARIPSAYLVAAFVFAALQLQQATASSLQYAPYTTCTSYGIGNKAFPGRGRPIEDNGNCVVTVPKDPNSPKPAAISTVPVKDKSLLSNCSTSPVQPVFKKVGTRVMSENRPPIGTNPDAYVEKQQATGTSVISALPTGATARRLEEAYSGGITTLQNYFGTVLERKLKNLPTTAVYHSSPWAGSNWPNYLDGINFEWSKGQPSPAEKYAKAFGLDVTMFMNSVSNQSGVDSENYLPQCTTDSQCFDPKMDTVCGKRANATTGYCIPTWHGICHAWAPAAILEQEPNCPVTFNGVTFQPMDIKALVTDVYDDANISTVFTGSRYNGYNDSIDHYGRHTDYSYRDLNPGVFHIAAANILGLLNTTFMIDRDAGIEIWNQPVVGFKVYEQTTMSTEKAANTFYGLESYPWNENATSIVYVKSRLSWINETWTDGGLVASGLNKKFTVGTDYDYLLEIDENEEIIGGEWLYGSNDNHPDFLWLVQGKPPADTVTSIGLSYANVTMLLEKAVSCAGAGSAYIVQHGEGTA